MTSKRIIFWRLFFSYIVLLVVALCVTVLIYHTSIMSMEEAASRQSENTLEGIGDTVDTLLGNIENYAVTILYDEDITAFLSLGDIAPHSEAISDIYRYSQTLKKYRLAYSLIDDVYILLGTNNFVLYSNNAVRYTSLYHDSLFSFTGMSYEEMEELLCGTSLKNAYYLFPGNAAGNSGELAYIMKVPTSMTSGGTILIHVNTQTILNLLQPACTGKNSLAFILDDENSLLIACTESEPELALETLLADYNTGGLAAMQDDRYVITRVVSDGGWQYFSVIPRETILSDVYAARRRIMLITLLLVLVGIVLSYLLTRNKARSLGNMMAVLSSEIGLKHTTRRWGEYGLIEDAVTRLANTHSSFKTLSETQRRLIRLELVRRLLLGDFRYIDELQGLMSASGSRWANHAFGVMTLRLPVPGKAGKEQHPSDLSERLDGCLIRQCSWPFHILHIDNTRWAVLFLLEADCTGEAWHDFSEDIAGKISAALPDFPQAVCCVSRTCDRLEHIHDAYDETVVMAEYAKSLRPHRPVLRSGDLPCSEEFYYYPIDVELKLIQYIKTGNTPELEKLLNIIRMENFEKRVLSVAMIRQFVFAMRGTIVRCLRSIIPSGEMNSKMQELGRETTIEGIFDYTIKISMEICEIMNDDEWQKTITIKQAILDTIERNYDNNDFSIHWVADSLHMTEKNLYGFIRDHFNQTFWEMVEKVRINKACELLRNSDIPINKIAEEVGYSSDNSFRRAFRRIINMSPSTYMRSVH